MNPIIEIKNLSFAYQNEPVLQDLNFTINENDFIGIVGPNGGGKSTLLKLILGLLKPTEGDIKVFDNTPAKSRSMIGYVPQFATFNQDFPINVYDTILMGLPSFYNRIKKSDYQHVDEIMKQLGIDLLRDKSIRHLSGGEMQKVLIARALVSDPKLLLLDEPTSSTDPHAEDSLFDLLKNISKDRAILLVSHDIGFVTHYVQKVICLNKTLVCHPTEKMTPEIIEKLYGGTFHIIPHHKVDS